MSPFSPSESKDRGGAQETEEDVAHLGKQSKRTFVLIASSYEERDAWMNYLRASDVLHATRALVDQR